MAGLPNIFEEDTYVGGVPCFTYAIQKWLPKNKKERDRAYRIQMVILTYAVYALFNTARRPTAVVKSKIVEECGFANASGTRHPRGGWVMDASYEWCNEYFFASNMKEFMGFLDSVFLLMYGLCLFLSGVIGDCYNPRFFLTMGCVLSGFFCALLGLSDFWDIRSFKFYTMVLMLFGACQSTGWPVVLSSVTHWYVGGKRAMFFGVWNTHNYVGAILGTSLAAAWVDELWGLSFFIPGFILALMGIVVFSCMVVDPDDLKELDKEPEPVHSQKRRLTEMEIPQWLSQSRSIKLYEALKLPGVVEFSACMFFSRMVGYIYLFWLPTYIKVTKNVSVEVAAYYSMAYVVGGSLGGILAGLFVDLFRRSALVCALTLLVSIPVLFLGQLSELGTNIHFDFPIYMLIGLSVEAPYVVTSTSVSADLGTHKMIKRNHRAISTIGGIVEGTGAVGAAIGTYICGVIMTRSDWDYVVYMMMLLQFIAALCISKYAYEDFIKRQERKTLTDFFRTSAIL